MSYSLEPAFIVSTELSRQLIKAGTDPVNQWFFVDGAFTANKALEQTVNTWLHENFVVIRDDLPQKILHISPDCPIQFFV